MLHPPVEPARRTGHSQDSENVSDAAVAVPVTADGRMNARPGLEADAQSGILQLMPETSANGQSKYQLNKTSFKKMPI